MTRTMNVRAFVFSYVGCCLLLANGATANAQDKLPVPGQAAQQKAAALVREVYQDEFAKAETGEAQLQLARKLIDDAMVEQDPTARYVCLSEAKKLAIEAASGKITAEAIDIAYQAVQQTSQLYSVKPLIAKASTLWAMTKQVRSPSQRGAIAQAANTLADEAAAIEDFELAQKLCTFALDLARKTGNTSLVKESVARNKRIAQQATAFKKVQESLDALDTDPTDPDANLAIGRHRALVQGKWEEGLNHLALGSDAGLKDAAAAELQEPKSAEQQLALADRWWNLAEGQSGVVQHNMQARAAKWYRSVVDNLSGLNRKRVENRLEELADVEKEEQAATAVLVKRTFPYVELARLASGTRYFPDRNYSFQNVPAALDGLMFTRFFADATRPVCEFEVPAAKTVFVIVDHRVKESPQITAAHDLLQRQQWKQTGTIGTTDGKVNEFHVFEKQFTVSSKLSFPGVVMVAADTIALADDRWQPQPVAEPKVVSRWKNQLGFITKVTAFYSNGRIDGPNGEATWIVEGDRLLIRWPHILAPGGAYQFRCRFSRDGRSYLGKNQDGLSVRGTRLE